MGNWQWLLDVVVTILLAATLLRAHRLERALTRLRQDSGGLEELMSSFDASTQAARVGLEKARDLAEGARRRVEQQQATALALKDDLAMLVGRGEQLAERLDHGLRAARTATPVALPAPAATPRPPWPREPAAADAQGPGFRAAKPALSSADPGRVRSQAERDLLVALQAAR